MDLHPDLLNYMTISEKTIVKLHDRLTIALEAMNDILGQEISLETRYTIAKALEKINSIE